ncbi:kinase-like domain-containing protein [Powellomyces hirtus]|nr:kinase-like domain-containing protein [Powellomyces hirtus]
MTLLDHIKNLGISQPPTAGKRKLYKTTKVLGEGTFGIVKEAIYTPTGRLVALKSIKKRGHDSPEEVEAAVRREMTVLEKIRHPNIISLLDWFETKEKYYLVFDLATGGELYDQIAKRGKFTERDAVRIVFTILSAVGFLHDRDIVHRDLKPENLLYRTLEEGADLVIADFGVANIIHEDELLKTLCGSPMYAAPEVIKRTGHGKPADLWSIGVITYCVLAGYPPFDFAQDMPDLMDAITHARFHFDSPYWDSISTEAKDFVSSLLRVRPNERPTARQAMIHPWLCKHSQRARDALAAFDVGDKKVPAPVATPVTPPAAPPTAPEKEDVTHHVPRKSISPPPGEEEELPNLVERVWSAHSDSLFNPRGKLVSAIRTVQAMRRLSLKKIREAAVAGATPTSSSESLPLSPQTASAPASVYSPTKKEDATSS